MQLEALKVFCDIVTLQSFSKAAEANEMSQPTVSRIVQQLEERLGGPLLDRSKRPLQATELGQVYHSGCKRLLEQYFELETSLRGAHTDIALTVQVAAIYSVGLWDMGQYVERFAVKFPQAKVRIDYLHPKQVYERVLDGTADLGLVSYPSKTRELDVLPWREEEMVVACAPTHAIANGRTIHPRKLRGQKFVTFDKELPIRRVVDRFLREHDVEVEVTLEFDNIENIKKGIEIGAGVGLLPEPMLRQEVQSGTLRALRLEGCELKRPLGIIHRRNPKLGAAAQGFIDLLRGLESERCNEAPRTPKRDAANHEKNGKHDRRL